MAVIENKFVVINRKRFVELAEAGGNEEVKAFQDALNGFKMKYEEVVQKPMNQEYLTCNVDEPYANQVRDIILSGEEAKATEVLYGAGEDDGAGGYGMWAGPIADINGILEHEGHSANSVVLQFKKQGENMEETVLYRWSDTREEWVQM